VGTPAEPPLSSYIQCCGSEIVFVGFGSSFSLNFGSGEFRVRIVYGKYI
jgi:hypothetical protein